MINKKMLDILVCPVCKGALIFKSAEKELICNADRLAFQFKGDIPILLKDEARVIDSVKTKN